MQKYWKSIALVLVIIASISVFYIQFAKLTDDYPEFVFKQMSGSAEAADLITMDGTLQRGMSIGESFKVTAKNGTDYLQDESYFQRRQVYYQSENYEQRKKEHRSFMRGKYDNEVNYDENDQYLAYADVIHEGFENDTFFEIDVLEKDSGDRTNFDIPLEQGSRYGYKLFRAVKMVDDQLVLIVESDNGEQTNVNQYMIDLDEERIKNKEALYTIERDNMNSYTEIHYLFNEDHPNGEVMLIEEETVYEETGEGEPSDASLQHVEVYDLVNHDSSEIDIPQDAGTPVAYDDATIYYSKVGKKELTIEQYDRKQEEITKEMSLTMESPSLEEDPDAEPDYILQDGKLYISTLYGLTVDPQVAVIDLEQMEIEYEGKIIPKNLNQNDAEFHFNNMEVTKSDKS